MRPRKNLTNQVFGKLTVVEYAHSKNGTTYWECACECGKNVVVCVGSLTGGRTKSCGCLQKQKVREINTIHGDNYRTKEYRAWKNMRERCRNPKNRMYPHYGERGISVCNEWENYKTFLSDMGRAPSPQHSLDRIDNNGNYEPTNCRWATRQEQAQNKQNNHNVWYKGELLPLTTICDLYGVSYSLVYKRVLLGWDIDTAIKQPSRKILSKIKIDWFKNQPLIVQETLKKYV